MKKYYSTDEMEYPYVDPEEAAAACAQDVGLNDGEIVTVYVAEGEPRRASWYWSYADPKIIAEEMNERAWDECGDIADDWPPISVKNGPSLIVKIEQAIDQWFDEHKLHPMFCNLKPTGTLHYRVKGGWVEEVEKNE